MKHIILIGLPNCGKSTLGKKVAKAMNMPFYDTDEMVTDKLALDNLADIFRPSFQRLFYEGQLHAVTELGSLKAPAVIATGAEVALMPQCVSLLREMGTVILIKRDVPLLLDAVSKRTRRLVLRDSTGVEIDMNAKAVEEYAKELAVYEKVAHKVFENNGDEKSSVTKFTGFLKEFYQLDVMNGNG
jgi:shikimate kinase